MSYGKKINNNEKRLIEKFIRAGHRLQSVIRVNVSQRH